MCWSVILEPHNKTKPKERAMIMTQKIRDKPLGSYCEKCETDTTNPTLVTLDCSGGAYLTWLLCYRCTRKVKKMIRDFFRTRGRKPNEPKKKEKGKGNRNPKPRRKTTNQWTKKSEPKPTEPTNNPTEKKDRTTKNRRKKKREREKKKSRTEEEEKRKGEVKEKTLTTNAAKNTERKP